MIPAGQLTRRVRFEQPPSTEASQDNHGQPSGTPTNLGTVWAKVEQLSGGETFTADQYQAEAEFLITIRRKTAVNTKCVAYWTPPGGTELRLRILEIDRVSSRFDDLIRASAKL